MPNTLDYVLKYADHGWASFPLRGKMPLHRCQECRSSSCRDITRCGHRLCHGFRGATTDHELLREWFADDRYNVGLAVPEGIVILDVDPRNGGDATLDKIRDRLPRTTLVSKSGRGDGGKHLWFAEPLDPVSLAGIDVKRAGKGYVLVEPSIHPETGGMYRWVNWGTPVARSPRTLPSVAPEGMPTRTLAQQLGIGGGKRELFEAILHGQTIYEGTQHDTVRDLAAYIASRYGEFDGRPLFDLCLTRCEIPHPEEDAERSWESAVAKFSTDDDEEDDEDFDDEDFGDVESSFDRDVRRTLHDMRVRDEAKRLLRQQIAPWQPIEVESLRDMLANPSEAEPYLIDRLWQQNGMVLFAAQAKTGKTTLTTNLVRSLVDGEPFLGQFSVTPLWGRVVLINVEVGRDQISRWFTDVSVEHQDDVTVINVRGRTSWFDVLDKDVRGKLAEVLRGEHCQVLIIDPVGPLWDAAGINENENSEVGPWLAGLTELVTSAGVSETMVVHHYGHSAQRARGASKLLDWPDALWSMTKDGKARESTVEEMFSGPLSADDGMDRYFQAAGRDVDVPKMLMEYDPETRSLTLDPHGIADRKAAQREAEEAHRREKIRVYVRDHPGCTRDDLIPIAGNKRSRLEDVKALLNAGELYEIKAGKALQLFDSGDEVISDEDS